jgi:hypothetical protein
MNGILDDTTVSSIEGIRELLDAAREKKSAMAPAGGRKKRGTYNCLKRWVRDQEELLLWDPKKRPKRVPGRRPRNVGPRGRRRYGIPIEKAEYERRFGSRLRRIVGCLIWQGAVDRRGCPRVKVKGRMVTLGRLTHETFVGPVPRGRQVRHLGSCMSLRCVDPQHLFWSGRDPSGGTRFPLWRVHIAAWRMNKLSVRRLLERGWRADGPANARRRKATGPGTDRAATAAPEEGRATARTGAGRPRLAHGEAGRGRPAAARGARSRPTSGRRPREPLTVPRLADLHHEDRLRAARWDQ